MSNSIKHLFSVVNTPIVGPVRLESVQPDGSVTITEKIQPILKDGKRQYSKNNNIRLTCDNDPNFAFPPVIKLSTMKKLVKGTQVQLTEGEYVVQSRNGVTAQVNKPKDENGKLEGYCSLVYMPKYVRTPGKECSELG